ncbi:MAG: hypothetical protein HC939_08635 [Pleurocapsa sp. SU_5_0]|nr:hypothetical protein [Pleurocapsa sp. SU_5_0]
MRPIQLIVRANGDAKDVICPLGQLILEGIRHYIIVWFLGEMTIIVGTWLAITVWLVER